MWRRCDDVFWFSRNDANPIERPLVVNDCGRLRCRLCGERLVEFQVRLYCQEIKFRKILAEAPRSLYAQFASRTRRQYGSSAQCPMRNNVSSSQVGDLSGENADELLLLFSHRPFEQEVRV